MHHEVTIDGSERRFICAEESSILAAMTDSGCNALPVGCRSGGCGVCRVEVLQGQYETGQMSSAQVSDADRSRGLALACQLFPRSPLRLRARPRRETPAHDPEHLRFERFREQIAALESRSS